MTATDSKYYDWSITKLCFYLVAIISSQILRAVVLWWFAKLCQNCSKSKLPNPQIINLLPNYRWLKLVEIELEYHERTKWKSIAKKCHIWTEQLQNLCKNWSLIHNEYWVFAIKQLRFFWSVTYASTCVRAHSANMFRYQKAANSICIGSNQWTNQLRFMTVEHLFQSVPYSFCNWVRAFGSNRSTCLCFWILMLALNWSSSSSWGSTTLRFIKFQFKSKFRRTSNDFDIFLRF